MPDSPREYLTSVRPNFRAEGLYGEAEYFLQHYRATAPLDLSATNWRRQHPDGGLQDWRRETRQFLRSSFHYDAGPVDLQAETIQVEQREGFRAEKIVFNTAPWSRVEGWFLVPDGPGPFPGIVALHSWGGPIALGKDRLVSRGKTHPRLTELLQKSYGGRFFAEDLAQRGYAVIAIDAHHFGSRIPWGAHIVQNAAGPRIPPRVDPLDLDVEAFDGLCQSAEEYLYPGVRYLQWAGTTWAGLNLGDDSRCIDYLLSRPEVDPIRIGCVGHSGGGWRAHVLAAMDDRIAASVNSCWTTTNSWSHLYNFSGTVGCFCMLPGVWRRLDLPDLIALAAPRPILVMSGLEDALFAPEAMQEAAVKVQAIYNWAESPATFQFHAPPKPHGFDEENQLIAWRWFDRWLKPAPSYSSPTSTQRKPYSISR